MSLQPASRSEPSSSFSQPEASSQSFSQQPSSQSDLQQELPNGRKTARHHWSDALKYWMIEEIGRKRCGSTIKSQVYTAVRLEYEKQFQQTPEYEPMTDGMFRDQFALLKALHRLYYTLCGKPCAGRAGDAVTLSIPEWKAFKQNQPKATGFTVTFRNEMAYVTYKFLRPMDRIVADMSMQTGPSDECHLVGTQSRSDSEDSFLELPQGAGEQDEERLGP